MRRFITLALAATIAGTVFYASPTLSQVGRNDPEKEAKEAAKKKKRDEEWNSPSAPLPQLRNAGPCPFVKVLYDAGRYIEFKDGQEASGAVAYTGEVQGISAGCRYKDEEPIQLSVELLFALGKGPQGADSRKNYRYWVAVTDRNRAVLSKEWFDLPVTFPAGQDRVMVTEKLEGITIPRAGMQVSGSNFEVLVGFEVTPQNAAFNRIGKRFKVNSGAASTGAP